MFNRKQGEIQQRQAEIGQAVARLRQTEVEVRQDVKSAAARVAETREWVREYQTQILPGLEKSRTDLDELFRQGQPGVDILKVLDVRRKLLRARDGYLDALLSSVQAAADLAQAVGDPNLAIGQSRVMPR